MGWLYLVLRWTKLVSLMLASAALTLFLLFSLSSNGLSGPSRQATRLGSRLAREDSAGEAKLRETRNSFSTRWKHNPNTKNLTFFSKSALASKGWTVLAGNVVVHEGIAHNPHDYSYLINYPDVCKSFDSNELRLLIFVESDVRHTARRQAIRETWGVRMLQDVLNFRIVFLVGRSATEGTQMLVRDEHYTYGDMVQENFTESFYNLGLKSVMGLKWAATFCPDADYVLKTDEDIFLHIPNLLTTLKTQKRKNLLLCHRNRVRKIVRRNSSLARYEVPSQLLPGSLFPEYCAGFSYAMSRDVVHRLYLTSLKTPYFFIEDVYITGFCRHKANVELVDHPAFTLRPQLAPAQASCAFPVERRITSQELVDDEMRQMWTQLNTRGFFCPKPV